MSWPDCGGPLDKSGAWRARDLQTSFRSRDDFATIDDGQLKLKRDDKVLLPPAVTTLQKVLDACLPSIRIELLLVEVDQQTQFSQHFTALRGSQSRPQHFYRTLLATLISQATNLGVVAMSASVKGTTVDTLRHGLHDFVREDMLVLSPEYNLVLEHLQDYRHRGQSQTAWSRGCQ